jgi:lipid A 3-O-deacylase
MLRFHRALMFGLALPCLGGIASDGTSVPTIRARHAGTFTFYFENDYFGGTDRHYTNGLKASWLLSDLSSWGREGWWRQSLEALPFVNRPEAQKNLGIAFGQNIYTPQDQKVAAPDPTDRPYAGWSYFELTLLSKTGRVADMLSFQAGMVGRHSYAQDLQRVMHEWLNDSQPQGWPYQLRDEFGLNVIYERKWRFHARAPNDVLGADFVPHVGVSLGNVQTHANAGGTLRLGYNLPSDFGVQWIRPGGAGNSPVDDDDPRVAPNRRWGFYVFGAIDGRAIARDIFLDGNTFREGPSVEKRRLVADISYGFGVINGAWQLTFTQVFRTREFETQPYDFNDFGSLAVSRAF